MYTLKKSLGQHFLKDETICRRIIAVLEEGSFEKLLEVGPGGGALTKYLIRIPDIDFKAVELDREKILYLKDHYPELSDKIIEGSILEIAPPFKGNFTLIGNFPYNISTQIMFRVLEWRDITDRVIGMFQKEVAVRIASGPGNKDYGILSVMLQAYFKVEYHFDVDEDCFNPPPKVKSGVISLINTNNPYHITDYRKLLILVKAAFSQRRKQLRNPLKALFPASELSDPIFTRRAEQLSVEEYVSLIPRMG
ncbi:MAG: 16S rRNA (adenine(1518)-N(6)/adenine(1519)-N(6))-dimethyltransferase RsmA [Chitinophagaceae bacterium]